MKPDTATKMLCQLKSATSAPLPAASTPPMGTPVCLKPMAVARRRAENQVRMPFAVAGLTME